MANKIQHKSKKWIDPNTSGFIYTQVEHDDGYLCATLKLADCARIVSFDVYIDSKKARDKTVKKVQLMVDEMTKFNEILKGLSYGG